jgi:hypothetical protein
MALINLSLLISFVVGAWLFFIGRHRAAIAIFFAMSLFLFVPHVSAAQFPPVMVFESVCIDNGDCVVYADMGMLDVAPHEDGTSFGESTDKVEAYVYSDLQEDQWYISYDVNDANPVNGFAFEAAKFAIEKTVDQCVMNETENDTVVTTDGFILDTEYNAAIGGGFCSGVETGDTIYMSGEFVSSYYDTDHDAENSFHYAIMDHTPQTTLYLPLLGN